ncbi:uncharacterized protein VTP21DRAFT_11601 [Calcarisporiella thermophila]|uniref:uncharacterized protein n=1 Tax=Calcarisporiella thermophila TaxID=911321 RepID=UPI003742D2AB
MALVEWPAWVGPGGAQATKRVVSKTKTSSAREFYTCAPHPWVCSPPPPLPAHTAWFVLQQQVPREPGLGLESSARPARAAACGRATSLESAGPALRAGPARLELLDPQPSIKIYKYSPALVELGTRFRA